MNDSGTQPLSVAVQHILLALSGQAMHGYGILKEIERQSGRKYRMGPGTLYDNLRKLIDGGLVEDLPASEEQDDKRMYRISRSGAAVLAAELARLESVLKVGRRRLKVLGLEDVAG